MTKDPRFQQDPENPAKLAREPVIDNEEMARQTNKKRWRARIIIGIIMLALAFIGLVINDLEHHGDWTYWRVMAPLYAVLSIWLTYYLRKSDDDPKLSLNNIWRQIVHWIVLFVAIFIITLFVNSGLVGRLEGGLVVLVLISMVTFNVGLYFDSTLMLIGFVLGLFSVAAGLIEAYLSIILAPVIIVGVVILFIMMKRGKARGQ